MVRKRMTRSQHVEVGARLKRLNHEVLELLVLVVNAFPKTGPDSKPGRELRKAMLKIGNARSYLDDIAARDIPGDEFRGIYYG
jgi:hypothetical protein